MSNIYLGSLNAIQEVYAKTGLIAPVGVVSEKPEPQKVSTPSAICADNVVTMSCATDGATIMYSTDGSTFVGYTGPITITETTTYSIKAVKAGMTDSDTITFVAEHHNVNFMLFTDELIEEMSRFMYMDFEKVFGHCDHYTSQFREDYCGVSAYIVDHCEKITFNYDNGSVVEIIEIDEFGNYFAKISEIYPGLDEAEYPNLYAIKDCYVYNAEVPLPSGRTLGSFTEYGNFALRCDTMFGTPDTYFLTEGTHTIEITVDGETLGGEFQTQIR